MPRYQPRTFAEARAIVNPVERAAALLKLSQESEDRRRATSIRKGKYGPGIFGPDLDTNTWEQVPTTQNDDGETVWETVDGPCSGDCYVVAFGFVGNVGAATYYVVDAYDEAEAMNAAAAAAKERGDNGVFTREQAIDYLGAGEDGEPNDAIPLDFDDMFADPDTKIWKLPATPTGSAKAARPAVRKAISRGTDGQKADKALGTALTGLSNADMALSGNPEFGMIQKNLRGARDVIAQARQDIRDYEANPGNKAARPEMRKSLRKSYDAISNASRVVKAAQKVFDQLMGDDYFSETYSADELADAAIEIAMRTTGTGPKTKKIVRETGNMFI